jgi:SAM-dependent methyltransferase
MMHEDRRRAGSFGEDAAQYDRARPAYPPKLVDHLLRDRPTDVIDVGCGTGIAARMFAGRGGQVLGIEPDPRMAAVARRRGLRVEDGTFEEWDPAGRRFDLLISAQAWHWVDPVRGATKAAQVLRPGGRAGVFWNRGQPAGQLRAALEAAYARAAPYLGPGYALPSAALDGPDEGCRSAFAAFAAMSEFDHVTIEEFGHTVEYTTAQWIDQLPTHSDHRTLSPDQLAAVLAEVRGQIDRLGGHFEMPYITWLVEAHTPAQ